MASLQEWMRTAVFEEYLKTYPKLSVIFSADPTDLTGATVVGIIPTHISDTCKHLQFKNILDDTITSLSNTHYLGTNIEGSLKFYYSGTLAGGASGPPSPAPGPPAPAPGPAPSPDKLCTGTQFQAQWHDQNNYPNYLTWAKIINVWNQVSEYPNNNTCDAIMVAAGEANPYPSGDDQKVTGLVVTTENSTQHEGLWQAGLEWYTVPSTYSGWKSFQDGKNPWKSKAPSDYHKTFLKDPCKQAWVAGQTAIINSCSKMSACSSMWNGGDYSQLPIWLAQKNKINKLCQPSDKN